MKIALVNTLYAPYELGGAERAVQILAQGLRRRGHSVAVITLGEAGSENGDGGVRVHRLALRNWYWPYSGFAANAAARAAWHARDLHNAAMSAHAGSILDRESPDVLHTNNLAGFSVAIWREAERRRVPVVHTLHDYYLMCPPSAMYRRAANCAGVCARCRPFAAYRRRASQAVQAVVGVSRFILDRHVGDGFFRKSGARKVVFNSVRLVTRAADRRRESKAMVFGYIGRIRAEKGVRWLLESFTYNARPGDRLVIAGRGDAGVVESLKAEFASPAVTFLGHVDPAVFFDQVDVAVVPSLWNEPFGRTVIEALAYGIPVIASNRGGIPEVIQDGETGLIVDPDVPSSLARAMARFATEPDLAGLLGRNAAQRLPEFSEENALEAYESLYAGAAGSVHRD